MNKAKVFFVVITLFALVLLVQPFLKAHFAFSGNVSDSAGDYIAYAQICPTGCTDECSYYGQKTCASNTSYKTCGNYDCDTCLEWSSITSCGAGKVCQNGNCVVECTTHNYKSCNDNDVYWYNSCNAREDKSSECGDDGWTSDYQCSGNILQRKWLDKGCSNASCFSNASWKTSQDCGSDSWTNNYRCSGDSIQREKNKKGCSGSSCYNYNQWEN
ncbi:hypothetical protein KJ562_01140, partial [Patescibacteria group bacterium]|nr:hypothetical protein [Patescibacteria group bacterium]